MSVVYQEQGARNGGAWLVLPRPSPPLNLGGWPRTFVGTKETCYKIKGFSLLLCLEIQHILELMHKIDKLRYDLKSDPFKKLSLHLVTLEKFARYFK